MSPVEITVKVTANITIGVAPELAARLAVAQEPGPLTPRGDTLRAELRSRAVRGLLPVDPKTGCRAHRNKCGVVQLGKYRVSISSLIWENHHGADLPEGHIVWRSCATKGCRAAAHLLAGTRQQMDDWRRSTWPND